MLYIWEFVLCVFYINPFIDVDYFHCNEMFDIGKSIISLVWQEFIYIMNVVFKN